MSIDILQKKIRKSKKTLFVDMSMKPSDIPQLLRESVPGMLPAYAAFCRAMIDGLQNLAVGLRFSFTPFSMLDGISVLKELLIEASEKGYYVLLDTPGIMSSYDAELTAELLLGETSGFYFDGLVLPVYMGSDVVRPFISYAKEKNVDLFVSVRSGNKSASEIQDLLSGSRQVYAVAADHVNRFASGDVGRSGYSSVGIAASATSAESLRNLRTKYPQMFLLADYYDYPGANAKNCAYAFDKFGHGAAVCAGRSITCAWKKEEGCADFVAEAQNAAERIQNNINRYINIL